jgi:hypothetical protein
VAAVISLKSDGSAGKHAQGAAGSSECSSDGDDLTGGDSLRYAAHELIASCLRRLEASENTYPFESDPAYAAQARAEVAAERLVSAAASVGDEAIVMVAHEVGLQLEACVGQQEASPQATGISKGGMEASTPPTRDLDLSRIAAALALAHALAIRPRVLSGLGSERRLAKDASKLKVVEEVTRSVQRLHAALQKPGGGVRVVGGKRGLQAGAVATHAQHCLTVLAACGSSSVSGKPQGMPPALSA